jgi:two-component system OmpR family sensor kinase
MTGERGRRPLLRTRVLAGVLAITIVAFAAFDAAAVAELHSYLVGRVDSSLQTVLNLGAPRLDRLLARSRAGRATPVLQAGLGAYDYLAFVPDHGRTVVLDAVPGVAPALPADLTSLAAGHHALTVDQLHGQDRLRLRAQPVDGGTLVVTASLDDVKRTTGKLRLIVIIGSAIAVALIALGVLVVVRRGLRPLEAMATQADRISAGDLTSRVGPGEPRTDDSRTEVGRLATALNGMLARIDAAVQEREADQDLMRRFFADASHELRNPLASLRANAELYEQGALRDRGQVDEAMRRIGLEAERMSQLVDDMLGLARLDQHPDDPHEAVDLTDLLRECVERARITDPERTWNDAIGEGLVTAGDAELLRRALDNLVANVGAHTPIGTVASITAARDGPWVKVEVSDDGPGVPADRLARIFDRFYRADPQTRWSGSGLGLAIVNEIAATHHGHATATLNDPHGLRVTLSLPASDPGPIAGSHRTHTPITRRSDRHLIS